MVFCQEILEQPPVPTTSNKPNLSILGELLAPASSSTHYYAKIRRYTHTMHDTRNLKMYTPKTNTP